MKSVKLYVANMSDSVTGFDHTTPQTLVLPDQWLCREQLPCSQSPHIQLQALNQLQAQPQPVRDFRLFSVGIYQNLSGALQIAKQKQQ